VKSKIDMVDNLLEIELAYNLLSEDSKTDKVGYFKKKNLKIACPLSSPVACLNQQKFPRIPSMLIMKDFRPIFQFWNQAPTNTRYGHTYQYSTPLYLREIAYTV
jgi:hypothetical protein